jgi:hypothetical protein
VKNSIMRSPCFILRVAGVPAQGMFQLSAPDTRRALSLLHEQTAWLDEQAAELTSLLEKEVPNLRDDALRNRLIRYKRDLGNRRLPRERAERFAVEIPARLLARLQQWEAVRTLLPDLERRAEACYEEELRRCREEFQKQVAHPNLLQGLLFTSHSLHEKASRYIETPIGEQHARLRKAEVMLTTMLSRAAAKTSPYSTFTTAGLGVWAESAPDDGITLPGLHQRSHVRFHDASLLRIIGGMLRHPQVKREADYRLNETLEERAGKIRFLRRLDDNRKSPRTYRNFDSLIALDASPPLRLAMQAAAEAQGAAMPYAEWAERLIASSGAPAETVHRVLQQLIDLQVLEADWPFVEQEADLLGKTISFVETFGAPVAKEIAAALRDLQGVLASFPEAGLDERSGLMTAMRALFERLCQLVGLNAEDTPANMICFEDAVLDHTAALSARTADGWMEDLAAWQRLMPLFDTHLPLQTLFAAEFVARYGEEGVCDDPRAFLEELVPLYFSMFPRMGIAPDAAILATKKHGVLRALEEARQQFTAWLEERRRDLKPLQEEIVLAREELDRFHEQLPEAVRRRSLSNDVFTQAALRDGSSWLVINDIWGSTTRYLSRYLPYLDEAATEGLRSYLRSLHPSDELVAELSDAYGYNANLHPPLTPYELTAPFLPRAREAAAELAWRDLVLCYDRETQRLILRHRERGRVHLLVLGFLLYSLKPYFSQVLEHLFTYSGKSSMMPLFPEEAVPQEELEQIRFLPRVRVGRVVIERKKWIVPRARLILRGPKESEFAWFARVQAWQQALGLPRRVFLRFVMIGQAERERMLGGPDGSGGEGAAANMTQFKFQFKPQLIDFDNPLLVRLFGKLLLDHPYSISLEEMLPDAEELALQGEEPRVSELVFNITQN